MLLSFFISGKLKIAVTFGSLTGKPNTGSLNHCLELGKHLLGNLLGEQGAMSVS